MSNLNTRLNYYPGSELTLNLLNGSSFLSGNENCNIHNMTPKQQFQANSKISGSKYHYSQHHHIDPIYSLLSLKKDSSLTRYYHHNLDVEQCRDRYIFVPKFISREEPNQIQHDGLNHLKYLAQNRAEYLLNKIPKLPDMETHVLPKENLGEEAFRLYGAKQPYDMTVLRDVKKFNPIENTTLHGSNRNFMSSTTFKQ